MKMKWMMTGAVLAGGVYAGSQPPEAERPNVVLIMTDDQGYGDLSNMDHPYLKTPNMDRLKAEGVSFENFLVAPVCAPTRAGLMTGRYTYRTGVHDTYQSRVNMWSDEKTIAEYLKDAGYSTGLFGKWHIGYNAPLTAGDQGFDTYITWEEMQHSRQRPLLEENGRFSYYPKVMSDVFCDKAVEFIRANKERPFFCYWPLYLPHAHHDNMEVETRYTERFQALENLTPKACRVYGMIEKADELLGRVLDAIDAAGLRENTIVIFLSDNGPTYIKYRDGTLDENGGLRGHKGQVYEGGIRVPFYVRWPGRLPAGKSVETMGNYTDVLPTLLELCGATPDQWEKPLDGRSLVPLLASSSTDWPDRFYFMHFQRQGPQQILANMWENGCVRGERWKLVNGDELYDLQNDPDESENLAAKYPQRVIAMRGEYKAWFESVTGERNLTAAPNYVGAPGQAETMLYFFEKDQEVDPAGWPIDVKSTGPYMICVENLQHTMFGDEVTCTLRCGDVEISQPVDPIKADLLFEGVELPLGVHTFQIDFSGDVLDKKWRYNLADLGHRLVWIRKEP